MSKCLLDSKTFILVHNQQFLNEVLGVLGDLFPLWSLHGVLAGFDFFEDFRVVLSSEGRASTNEEIHDNATAPDVALEVVVGVEDLWRNVERRASNSGKLVVGHFRVVLGGQAEVDELDFGVVALV